jgi:hypothetical protein
VILVLAKTSQLLPLWIYGCLEEGMDTCALVVNNIHKRWETCHIMVQICEVHETSNTTMVVQLKALLA